MLRKLVAVGTVRLASIFSTIFLATPVSGVGSVSAPRATTGAAGAFGATVTVAAAGAETGAVPDALVAS